MNYDGTYNMWTGATSIDKVGQISEWNFFPKIDEAIYPGKCGELTGSAGEFFPPGRGKDYVDFFSPDLCRQAYLSHTLHVFTIYRLTSIDFYCKIEANLMSND